MKAKSSISLNKSKWIFHFSLFTYKQMDFSLFTYKQMDFSLFTFHLRCRSILKVLPPLRTM